MKYVNHFRDWVFRRVHHNNLIYNTCWEDPRCDRELMAFDRNSEIVMITSAGCNALDYLLDDPRAIHCVDMNPRQNALLALKRASLTGASFEDHFYLFGQGAHPDFAEIYRSVLQPLLPEYARSFWDRRQHYFNGEGVRRSFYRFGTSGAVGWMLANYLRSRPKLYRAIDEFFQSESLAEQQERYEVIEQKLLNQIVNWAVNQHLTMSLLGVPRSQQMLLQDEYSDGATGFLRQCLRQVFTNLPVQENYFWRLYFFGQYERDCCPNYLREDNFAVLGERQDRIRQYTSTLTHFLETNPGAYTHYILLDHQDWLAANDRPALEAEWRAILGNSRPGTRILLRSAASVIDFFPEFVLDAIDFVPQEEMLPVHQQDRVGTYASVYLGLVH
ncbi:MAG: BtaA family protein [Lewinella sp.]|nr:BtaA family protein [Lewinella sp.]